MALSRRNVLLSIISLACLALAPAPGAKPGARPDGNSSALPPAPEGAIVIHVSTSTGVDGQDGKSPETAVKTVRRGQALLRDGQGDRLLLKCGDTFEEAFGNWNKSGASPEAPLVIGSYGDGPRPKVVSNQTVFNLYGKAPLLHDVVISNIHFRAAGRDPGAPDYDPAVPSGAAVRIVRPVHRLTIQDCRFEFFNGNLVLTGDKTRRLMEIAIKRCIVVDAYSSGGATSGQGLYADKVDGLTIEDCVFDHNGWNEKVPGATANLFRHNIYISHDTSDVRVTGNVIANGASHGLQMRAGGLCEGNLFVDNAIHAVLAGEDATFRGNVIVGGRDIDASNPRGFGVTIAAGKGLVDDNLLVHKPTTSGGAITVEHGKWSPETGVHVEIRDNIIYDWSGNALEVVDPVKSVRFVDNDVQRIAKGRRIVTIKKPVEQATFSGNRYHSEEPKRDKWFNTPTGYVPPEQWGTLMRDTSRLEQARYRDAARMLPKDFLAGAREEREGYTAAAAIAQLREAFGKSDAKRGTQAKRR
jgi:hypothetical protein